NMCAVVPISGGITKRVYTQGGYGCMSSKTPTDLTPNNLLFLVSHFTYGVLRDIHLLSVQWCCFVAS
ncbi:hypothetical protein, partial [Acinetobacter baumannii]|uniref:hypothetical protein n=1 Tax=Acinetobacter baumannii TaxID=470 RepID=UPI001C454A54